MLLLQFLIKICIKMDKAGDTGFFQFGCKKRTIIQLDNGFEYGTS